MGGAQALKRVPRIKFPERHLRPSGSTTKIQSQETCSAGDDVLASFSSLKAPATVGGKASLQLKRTPVSNEEIEAILLGGCL